MKQRESSDKLSKSRLERIKRRLKNGYYLSDKIAEATAAKILESRDRGR